MGNKLYIKIVKQKPMANFPEDELKVQIEEPKKEPENLLENNNQSALEEWEEKTKKERELKDREESLQIEELRENAKKEIEEFLKNRKLETEKRKKDNIQDDENGEKKSNEKIWPKLALRIKKAEKECPGKDFEVVQRIVNELCEVEN